MAKKSPTTVIAVRAPVDVAEAIREEAEGRNMSVNELLNLELAAKFKRGAVVRKTNESSHESDLFIPEEDE